MLVDPLGNRQGSRIGSHNLLTIRPMISIRRLVLFLVPVWLGALGIAVLRSSEESPGFETRQQARARLQAESHWEQRTDPPTEERVFISSALKLKAVEPIAETEEKADPLATPNAVFAEPKVVLEVMSPDEAIARLARKPVDLTDPLARQNLVTRMKAFEDQRRKQTQEKAVALGYPMRTADGAVLSGFEGDHPLYVVDHNARAAISTGANLLYATPFGVTGSGVKMGLWEAGDIPRVSHQEFGGRVTVASGQVATTDSHATHVAGTLVAAGGNAQVKGMAPSGTVIAHDHFNEFSEMAGLAAAAAGDNTKIQLSNHSYGFAAGWSQAVINGQTKPVWYGTYDAGTPANSQAYLFGRYGTAARDFDDISWDAPYFLIVKSAGNDRNDAAPTSGTWFENADPSKERSFSVAPPSDFDFKVDAQTGYDTLTERSAAKNPLVVGSCNDAVSGGSRWVPNASLSGFSSAGPTDDGRIKPDLMANGSGLTSADDASDSATVTFSGTSMSSPNACGSAALLVDYYEGLYPGQSMLASTLKGLLIHTADDLDVVGPDYRTGWGLMNVKEAAEVIKDHHDNASGSRFMESQLDGSNAIDEIIINHDGNGPLRVSVCWTDPAGNATSAHDNTTSRLVHDLNLRVVGPTQTHLPYVMPYVTSNFDHSKLSDAATQGVNDVDNVEQVYIKQTDAPAGVYTIRVDYAGALAQGAQTYSVIVSGADFDQPVPQVTLENPVADLTFAVGDSDTSHDYADVNNVFSVEAVSFEVAVVPAGIISAVLQGDGTVDITPTGSQFGTATVTLTAIDAGANEAQDQFEVTVIPPILHVDASVSVSAPQDGSSWLMAFKYLQDALAVSQSGQQIWVAAGIYYPDQTVVGGATNDTNSRSALFSVRAGVSLFGGFAGGEIDVAAALPLTNSTHLSGDIDQNNGPPPGSYASGLTTSATNTNSYHVVNLSSQGASDVFSGFIVSGGHASGGALRGGGIYSYGGSSLITNCRVAGNFSSQSGGGIYLRNGTPKVRNCVINGNKSDSTGGGLWSDSSDVDLQSCEFRGNDASGAGAFGVGKVLTAPAAVRAVNCLIAGNRGLFGSGGVQVYSGNLSLTNCTISGNRSSSSTGGGVLISSSDQAVKISNCIIWRNYAGANQTGAPASSVGIGFGALSPVCSNSLIEHCGGSGAWEGALGTDGGGNLDVDPSFVSLLDPAYAVIPSEGGVHTLNEGSAALHAGSDGLLPGDSLDLDGDGDVAELLPLDLVGVSRQVGSSVDIGAYEMADLTLVDSDGDGISDSYELGYSGSVTGLAAMVDSDGDGLGNLTEFALGTNPDVGISEPVGAITAEVNGGTGDEYLTITYEIDDDAVLRGGGDGVGFVTVQVERRTDLNDANGWKLEETTVVSQTDLGGGIWRIVERSNLPFGYQPQEFFRLRTDVAVP